VTLLHRRTVVASTQDEAFVLAASGAPAGTAVVAEVQEGGRGSRGQRWASAAGGLWLSVLLRPAAPAAPELASLRAGLAVAQALGALDDLPAVQLKWPNDLLIDGRKVGGVLVEAQWTAARLEALVIGVGLNVRNVPPTDARWPAVRLAEWLPAVQVEAVLRLVLPALQQLSLDGASLAAAEITAFASRDALRGAALAEPSVGTADGVADDGQLRVRAADGTITLLRSGPIVPVAAPGST